PRSSLPLSERVETPSPLEGEGRVRGTTNQHAPHPEATPEDQSPPDRSMPTASAFPDLRTEIAGVSVADIARKFGTPTFVYDAATIVERINDLRAFDTIRYAQKANSNLAVLDLVRSHGVLVDAVSAGEVGRALAAGYEATGDPPPIVYTADIF